ncbi:ABC di/oligopeptide transporter inner membrane subunit [Propionigenium maris DSM 9537]|uniref:ABC di/oligopeptide transporter inner membrane subunit n=1 Tax=Propionigenium maris DSM 9537 TaxID=1123000 RepID=A0A9W6GJ10_9FUSO|nr:ABC transporter permease [Propionigenium maris]GLI55078.1 ABC di/oligopeptide transporter inner membrane subunit [Propionigenium maris DSM 9537]
MIYFIKRIGIMLFTLFLVSVISFSVFQIIPGDPALSKLGMEATQEQVEMLRTELMLDKPLSTQYIHWAKNILRGDLGESIRFSRPIEELIKERIVVTLTLGIYAILIAVAIGIPLGILSAKYNDTKLGVFLSVFSQVGLAIPEFWLGIIFLIVFGIIFRLFSLKYIPFSEDPISHIKIITLPALALAISRISVVARHMKNIVLEEQEKDYVRTAYSKGLSANKVYICHILQNALIPTITIIGMLTAGVLGGAIVVEQVFNLPGIGTLLINGVTTRDIPLVQAIITYIASVVVIINFLIDILYRAVDPRISI